MDDRAYRDALGSFATGVTVVAALDADGAPWGLTANAFASVSLTPRLVSVCVARRGRAFPVLAAASAFAITILAGDQRDVALRFAGAAENRFAEQRWDAHPGGGPVLPDAAAWLDCAPHARVAAGDHEILIGRVVRFGRTPRAPLAYCRGAFFAVEPQERAHG